MGYYRHHVFFCVNERDDGREFCNQQITNVQILGGLTLGIPLFFLLAPFAFLDGSNPKVPFSIYVRATKPMS